MEKSIVPSIIAGTQEEIDQRINKVKSHVKSFQLDVMDGKFVPTRSLDFKFTLPKNDCTVEAHLMVQNPLSWLSKRWDIVDTIIVHVEALDDPEIIQLIKLIKNKGKKAGIAINPTTPIEKIKPYLDKISQVLVMTVNPGYYGAEFLPKTLDKVRELRKRVPDMDIEVDGGMNPENIKDAADAGANLFVVGSFIQASKDAAKSVQKLKKGLKKEAGI